MSLAAKRGPPTSGRSQLKPRLMPASYRPAIEVVLSSEPRSRSATHRIIYLRPLELDYYSEAEYYSILRNLICVALFECRAGELLSNDLRCAQELHSTAA